MDRISATNNKTQKL